MKTYLLFDLPYVVHRAGHASREMTMYSPRLKRELFTGPAKIAVSTILAAYRSVHALGAPLAIDRLILCDEFTKSFRFKLHPGYKASRIKARAKYTSIQKTMRKDLKLCKDIVAFVFQALGSPVYWKGNREADDIMGSLNNILAGNQIYNYTADSDMLQLCLNSNVKLMVTKKGKNYYYGIGDMDQYHKETVNKTVLHWNVKTGLEVLLYKSLVGDPGDDYGGVPGIGIVSFNAFMYKLRDRHGSKTQSVIYNLLANPDSFNDLGLKDKLIVKTCKNLNAFRFSLRLAKLKCCEKPDTGPVAVQMNDVLGTCIKSDTGMSGVKALLESYGMLGALDQINVFKELWL